MHTYIIAAAMALFMSCGDNVTPVDKNVPGTRKETVVVLQPLGQVPANLLAMLRDSIPAYYPVKVSIALTVALPGNSYYAPRNRYRADSILTFLNSTVPKGVQVIAAITSKDISTTKNGVADWGVMGLGNQPGHANVVSTYRLQKGNPPEKLFMQRLLRTVVHELGHNFGLPHCPDEHCIMADAKGKLNQDGETGLCAECRSKLHLP